MNFCRKNAKGKQRAQRAKSSTPPASDDEVKPKLLEDTNNDGKAKYVPAIYLYEMI
jgi:hypothetical protein